MDAVTPCVAKCLNNLGLAGNLIRIVRFERAVCCGPLEVAVELDAIGRVEVDALHFATQALALGETGHHLKRVAEDHAVTPVLIMLIELGLIYTVRDAVE